MENTSKGSPFAAAIRSYENSNDYMLTRSHEPGLHAFRHWRPGSATLPAAPIEASHDRDPYLLVLLADQEFAAYRTEQAESLIEAAYAAYDQCRFGS